MTLNDVAYQQYLTVNPTTLGNVFIRRNFYSIMTQITYLKKPTVAMI